MDRDFWMDGAARYGAVTRILHWLMATLILWQFVGMGLRLLLGRTPLVSFFVGYHGPVGAVLWLLILIRILWALVNRNRRPSHGSGLLALVARAGHGALYLLMLVIPSIALIRAWGGTRPFAPWGIPVFPGHEHEVAWAVRLGDLLHGELAWLLGLLVLGHIAMVALHEGLWGDGTLRRMVGR